MTTGEAPEILVKAGELAILENQWSNLPPVIQPCEKNSIVELEQYGSEYGALALSVPVLVSYETALLSLGLGIPETAFLSFVVIIVGGLTTVAINSIGSLFLKKRLSGVLDTRILRRRKFREAALLEKKKYLEEMEIYQKNSRKYAKMEKKLRSQIDTRVSYFNEHHSTKELKFENGRFVLSNKTLVEVPTTDSHLAIANELRAIEGAKELTA